MSKAGRILALQGATTMEGTFKMAVTIILTDSNGTERSRTEQVYSLLKDDNVRELEAALLAAMLALTQKKAAK